MLRIPTIAALALGAAVLTPAEARVIPPAGIAAPAAIEQAGGRWDDRRGWDRGRWDDRGRRDWDRRDWDRRDWDRPRGQGWGWGPPPRPGWYFVPPPRHYGWAPPPPRHVPARPRVEFGFRF